MSNKVVTLHGQEHLAADKPNPKVVEILERCLAEAKEGKMQSLGIVGLDGKRAFMVDMVLHGWNGLELLGGVHLLAHRITAICEHGE